MSRTDGLIAELAPRGARELPEHATVRIFRIVQRDGEREDATT